MLCVCPYSCRVLGISSEWNSLCLCAIESICGLYMCSILIYSFISSQKRMYCTRQNILWIFVWYNTDFICFLLSHSITLTFLWRDVVALSKFKSTQHHNLAVAADDDDCDVVAPLSFSTSSLCIAYAQLPFNQRVEKQKKTTTQIYYHRRYWWVLFYHFTQRRARVMILLRMDFVFSAYLIIA